ncbi:MAG: pyridoxamine 5'-phosphate oxidase family protein [Bacillota bacterium]
MENQSSFDFNLNLKKLNDLIKGFKIAMLTTISKDLTLHSSPLLTQELEFDGDLWFLISKNSQKAEDLHSNHHVCISYASGTKYVSVTGTADLVEDPEKVQELWHKSYQAWFPKGLQDPTIQLLRINVEKAEFWEGHSMPVMSVLEFMNTATGGHIKMGEHGELNLRH